MYNPNAKKIKQRPFVYLYKIDVLDEMPHKIRLPETMKELFQVAQKALDLKRPVRQIFDSSEQDRKRYETIEDIENVPKAKLYVSCVGPLDDDLLPTGESFQTDFRDRNAPLYRSRLPLNPVQEHFNRLAEMKTKQPKPKPVVANAVQHQVIAASPQTVQENMRDSLLSLFANMTPEQKSSLSSYEALNKLANNTSYFSLEHSLLSQFIGPSSVIVNTEIAKLVNTWIIDRLKGLKPPDCRFVIVGPSKSGKSTLLNSLVMMFYQKLQISGEASNYLVFPLNWSLYTIFLEDITKRFQTEHILADMF